MRYLLLAFSLSHITVHICQVSATAGVGSDGRMYSIQVFLGTLQNATDVSDPNVAVLVFLVFFLPANSFWR